MSFKAQLSFVVVEKKEFSSLTKGCYFRPSGEIGRLYNLDQITMKVPDSTKEENAMDSFNAVRLADGSVRTFRPEETVSVIKQDN